MDRQESREAEATHELAKYWWVDGLLAIRQFRNGHSLFKKLKEGHVLVSDQQFIEALRSGELCVLMLPNYCAALVEWHSSKYGRTLNILTVTASDLAHTDEALEAVIAAAKHDGAGMIFSVGKPGWKAIVERHGFVTKPAMFMQKVF